MAASSAVTLDFDLMAPKPYQFIIVPRCTNDKCLVKIHQQILEISQKHIVSDTLTRDGRVDRSMQCESKNPAPPSAEDLWQFFQNGWEFFNQILHNFYAFLSMLDYELLFNDLQL